MYLFPLPYEVPPVSTEQAALLRTQAVGPDEPGTILHDFETLLDFVGEEGVGVSARQHVLGGRSLMDLNARLVHPHTFSFKRPRQQSFPRVHALYLLLRAMGMAYVERRGSKHVLVPDAAVTASWDQLTLTEQYFNLFAAWMTRLDEQAILGDRVDPVGPLYRCFKFIEEIPDEGWALTSREEMEDFRYYPGFHHLALMDLFGLVTLEEADSEDGWEIRRIERRPFGEALIHLAAGRYQSALAAAEVEMVEEVDWNPEALQQAVRPYVLTWQRNVRVPLLGFREGTFVFKVSLGANVWRRIAAPARIRLDKLSGAILDAFDFDHDHLDRYAYVDPFGLPVEISHPYAGEGPFTDEVRIGDVPLREGQAMSYVFDFGDWWEFDVLLEKIEPKQAKMHRPAVLASHGEAPEQYPEWEDEDDVW